VKITKIRYWGAAASLTLGACAFAILPASAALASTSSHWMDTSTLPDLGTCGPMTPGWNVEDDDPYQVPCVGALQDSLAAVGFSGVAVDGLYGQATWSAVWCFQTAHQLNATGDADAQTIGLLDQIANSPAAMSPDNGESLQAPAAPEITGTVDGAANVDVDPPATDENDQSDDDYVP